MLEMLAKQTMHALVARLKPSESPYRRAGQIWRV